MQKKRTNFIKRNINIYKYKKHNQCENFYKQKKIIITKKKHITITNNNGT